MLSLALLPGAPACRLSPVAPLLLACCCTQPRALLQRRPIHRRKLQPAAAARVRGGLARRPRRPLLFGAPRLFLCCPVASLRAMTALGGLFHATRARQEAPRALAEAHARLSPASPLPSLQRGPALPDPLRPACRGRRTQRRAQRPVACCPSFSRRQQLLRLQGMEANAANSRADAGCCSRRAGTAASLLLCAPLLAGDSHKQLCLNNRLMLIREGVWCLCSSRAAPFKDRSPNQKLRGVS